MIQFYFVVDDKSNKITVTVMIDYENKIYAIQHTLNNKIKNS